MNASAPHVVWTHHAEDGLHKFLARAEGPTADPTARRTDVSGRLAAAFAGASDLVVLDLFRGFRPRRGEYILLVDVHGNPAPGTVIVKLGDPERLRREHTAFRGSLAAAPSGPVFMHQHPQPDADHLVALVYQDARAQ